MDYSLYLKNNDLSLLNEKKYIIGSDEVGYGAWAGICLVGAVKAPKDWSFPGLKDSKKLSKKSRFKLAEELLKCAERKEISYSLESKTNKVIDEIGLGVALKSAYATVFKNLYSDDSLIIVDGNLQFNGYNIDSLDKVSLIKADTYIPTVMAAAIIAKVTRDLFMQQCDKIYPYYDWKNNVGYPAAKHLKAIEEYGVSEFHRLSYKPLQKYKK